MGRVHAVCADALETCCMVAECLLIGHGAACWLLGETAPAGSPTSSLPADFVTGSHSYCLTQHCPKALSDSTQQCTLCKTFRTCALHNMSQHLGNPTHVLCTAKQASTGRAEAYRCYHAPMPMTNTLRPIAHTMCPTTQGSTRIAHPLALVLPYSAAHHTLAGVKSARQHTGLLVTATERQTRASTGFLYDISNTQHAHTHASWLVIRGRGPVQDRIPVLGLSRACLTRITASNAHNSLTHITVSRT